MNNKMIAFDFLRALAILMIIPAHLSNFLFSTYTKLGLYAFDPYFANMGLSLFIFMSGYLLYYNNNSITSFKGILSFYKKRLLRIFPLYWAALGTFVLVFFIFASKLNSSFVFPNAESVFSLSNMIVHILGLQIFLAPAYASPMLTLYFIGLIIVFYALYPFLIMFSKNTRQFLLVSLITFLGFLIASRTLNIIEHRFFMFFPIFVSGILTCKESLFEKSWTKIMDMPVFKILIAGLPVIFVLIIVLGSRVILFLDPKVSFTIESSGSGTLGSAMLVSMLKGIAGSFGLNYTTLKFVIEALMLNLFSIVFCAFEYRLAMKFIDNNLPSFLSSIFTYVATASYCIYLFHRPFFTIWNAGTDFITNSLLRDIVLICIAIPLLFVISYQIQEFEFSLKEYFSYRRISSKELSLSRFIRTLINQ